MQWGLVAVGGILACGLPALPGVAAPAARGGSPAPATVERVDAFEHLATPRLDPDAAGEGASPLRRACPESLDTCRRYWAYTGHFVQNTILPVRDRELLILRTAWLSRGDYIWGRHDAIGREVGLTAAEIARVTEGPEAEGWSDFDATLLRAADELHASRFLSDGTWAALGRRYDDAQRREVVLIVGNYTQLAMFQNTIGVQLPEGFTGLPDAGAAR